nr:hypothetical protein [Corynebacterium bovis]
MQVLLLRRRHPGLVGAPEGDGAVGVGGRGPPRRGGDDVLRAAGRGEDPAPDGGGAEDADAHAGEETPTGDTGCRGGGRAGAGGGGGRGARGGGGGAAVLRRPLL